MTVKRSLAGFAAVAALIFGGAACTGTETPSTAPQTAEKEPKSPPKADETADELNDVQSFELENRTEYGFDDFWVVYKITNDSPEMSDYRVNYEIMDDATGERVYNSTVYETRVKAGQTVSGEDVTVGPEDGNQYTVNITEVERTKSW